jgi:hypothetical protein
LVRGHTWGYYLSCRDGPLMLVLHRRDGEQLRIGGSMEVVVLEVHGGHTKLGLRCRPPIAHPGRG